MASMKAKPDAAAATTRTPKAVVDDLPTPTVIEATQPLQRIHALPVTAADIEADWDDEAQLAVVALPSGKRVQVRPVSMLSMIGNGLLPNTLLAAAKRSVGIGSSGNAGADAAQVAADAGDETAIAGVQLIDHMVCQMCVHPQFVAKPRADCAPGERSVFEVSDADKNFLFSLAMTGQQALKSGGGE